MGHRGNMIGALGYLWRLVATGGCFVVFGLGGLVLSLLLVPLLMLAGPGERFIGARWVIHKSFAGFMKLMEAFGVMRFEVLGAERLRECRGMLVLANHPTLIDVVALVSLMPMAGCVVKQALWRNPLLGNILRAARYVSNSEPARVIEGCAQDLASGHPLIIFPEGTRSRPGAPLRFLRGAAYVALHSHLPVLPVLIRCTPSTLTKQERWYHIPERRFCLEVRVLEPVHPCSWIQPGEERGLAARHLTTQLENLFCQELLRHGFSQA